MKFALRFGPAKPIARQDQAPPRLLPWLYFACAWIALAVAFAAVAWDPRGTAGFFYHARLTGIVHLVTLGWITMSILGALYVVGPLALRTPMPARTAGGFAFAAVAIGVIGMVAHFWIEEFSGMAWSGMLVGGGILHVGYRVIRGLWRAPIHRAVKLHILLAFANIAVAAAMGVLLGFDKVVDVLPGYVLANVMAHAHLAAIGWASMTLVGIGYRLIPMVLPSRPPDGSTMYASAILLETGVVGLFVTLMQQSRWAAFFAVTVVAGFMAFAAHAAVMLAHRRSPSVNLPSPDYSVHHIWLALGSLAVAAALGLVLAFAEMSETTLLLALVYGVFGLVGFLAQMIAGMQLRLLPLLAWFAASRSTAGPGTPGSPHAATSPRLAAISWMLWLWGVPALAAGFYFTAIPLVAAGALALEAAVLMGAIQALRAARCAFHARIARPIRLDFARGALSLSKGRV
jgi:hypothetical protein